MIRQCYRRIVLKTVDTDVVTLAISLFNEMGDGLDELWIDFGVGRNRTILSRPFIIPSTWPR